MTGKSALRSLPSVDRLLQTEIGAGLIQMYGRALTVDALRETLEEARAEVRKGEQVSPDETMLLASTRQKLEGWLLPTLRAVINATGVIVHTNLGRAPLSLAAQEAVTAAACGYSTLEFDLETGKRGSRAIHAEVLLQRVTGAEAALVVNNNAAGVLLALTALAGPTKDCPEGRGVIVSRGQLVEIGGGFRVPDVMAQSGARLVEVGTTNRTHLPDYELAIDETTALILRAHRSNFRIVGFATEPTLAELVALARQKNLLVVDDLGSGALLDTTAFGLAPEPMVQDSLRDGADVVAFSGDKLLGGPQSGILVGREEVIERLKKHPLARAVRADKLCLAALSATLVHYLKGEAPTEIPVWRMIATPYDTLHARAEGWATALKSAGVACEVVDGESTVGGGSLPGETLPTALLALQTQSPDQLAARLRTHEPPIIGRIEENRLVLDPRTVRPWEEETLLEATKRIGADL